jgi:hypothetical protein
MNPPGVRIARVVAADVRIGDELWVDGGWRRVVERVDRDGIMEITCDEPLPNPPAHQKPHTLERREPVLIRWTVPQTTTAMARELRRGRA